MDPGEAVEERFWQPLAATPLLQGVLGSKNSKSRRSPESLPQLSDENLFSVIQHCIQALQHALPCSVRMSCRCLLVPAIDCTTQLVDRFCSQFSTHC